MSELKLYNESARDDVERMMGKAVCARANLITVSNMDYHDPQFRHESKDIVEARADSELEATIRCIAIFAKNSVPEICQIVADRCKKEFDL